MSDDLRRVWDKAVRAAELRNRIPGRLGKPGGAVVVTARPGYLYVRLSSEGGQTVVIARNDGVPRLYDLPVWLELEHNTYVITGVDGTRLEAFLGTAGGGGGGVGYHTHAIGSGLEYEVEALRLEPGRVKHFTGLQVQINPFRYWTGTAWETYPGGVLDLTANKPATAGTHAWVLVGVNPSTNAAVAAAGTAYGYASPLTIDLIDGVSFNSYIPLMAIKVRADDTSLTDATKYQDARPWLDSPVGGGATDADAIHDNVAAEISAITAKTRPIAADLILIEDSAASNAKKSAQLKNMTGAVLGWFDVTEYGATGDGSTDDTTAIQSAIDAAETAGGGVVYFPRGIYIVGGALQDVTGANAQLTLPSIDAGTDNPIGIALIGEHVPIHNAVVAGIASMPSTISGAIIKGTLNSGAGGALLGVAPPAGSSFSNSRMTVRLENLTFRMPDNPVLSAVNLADVSICEVDNVAIDTGNNNTNDLTEPSTTTSYGLILPDNSNGATCTVDTVRIMGFYTGIQISEQTVVTSMHIMACKRAVEFAGGGHANQILRLLVQYCPRGIVITGVTYVDILQYAIEHYNETPSAWFDPIYDVDDASNHGRGLVRWAVVLGGNGQVDAFSVNGGANLQTMRITETWGGGGAVATDAIWDAKGDLAVGTGADTSARLAVGANNYVLTADSAQATGLKWAAVEEFDVSALTEELTVDGVADEALFYDTSAATHRKIPPWRFQSSRRMIYAATADKTVANTTDETSLFGDGAGTLTIPANSLIAGTVIHIYARGQLGDTGVPTINIKATLGGTLVCETTATALTGVTAVEWQLEVTITVRTIGATGTAVGGGLFDYDDGTEIALSSAGAGATIDTTGALDVGLTATWGTANASNTITARESNVDINNPPPGTYSATGGSTSDDLLLESGDFVLLESGDFTLLE